MKRNNKGFTLAELLIVVAIIAVLVAIAIPIFTSQLEKSREATDMANIRAAYAEITAKALTDPDTDASAEVALKQTRDDWQTEEGDVAGIAVGDIGAGEDGTGTVGDGQSVFVIYTAEDGTITIGGQAPTTSFVD